MKNLQITRATIKDVNIIHNFMLIQAEDERKYLNNLDNKNKKDLFYTKSEIKKIISSKNNYLVISKLDKILVGCGLAKIEKASKWNKYNKQGYLGMLYIDKKYRRKGIAIALQNNRINWLHSKGIKYLTCTVLSHNTPIINLLNKQVFNPHSIIMYKELK